MERFSGWLGVNSTFGSLVRRRMPASASFHSLPSLLLAAHRFVPPLPPKTELDLSSYGHWGFCRLRSSLLAPFFEQVSSNPDVSSSHARSCASFHGPVLWPFLALTQEDSLPPSCPVGRLSSHNQDGVEFSDYRVHKKPFCRCSWSSVGYGWFHQEPCLWLCWCAWMWRDHLSPRSRCLFVHDGIYSIVNYSSSRVDVVCMCMSPSFGIFTMG